MFGDYFKVQTPTEIEIPKGEAKPATEQSEDIEELEWEFKHQHEMPVCSFALPVTGSEYADSVMEHSHLYYPELYKRLLEKYNTACAETSIKKLQKLVQHSKAEIPVLKESNRLLIQFTAYQEAIKKPHSEAFDQALLDLNIDKAKAILLAMEGSPKKTKKKSVRNTADISPSLDEDMKLSESAFPNYNYKQIVLLKNDALPSPLNKNTIYVKQQALEIIVYWQEREVSENKLDAQTSRLLMQLFNGRETITNAETELFRQAKSLCISAQNHPMLEYLQTKVMERKPTLNELQLALLINELSHNISVKKGEAFSEFEKKNDKLGQLFISLQTVENFYLLEKSPLLATALEELFICVLQELKLNQRFWQPKSAEAIIPHLNSPADLYQFIQHMATQNFDGLTKFPNEHKSEEKQVAKTIVFKITEFKEKFLPKIKQYLVDRENFLQRLLTPNLTQMGITLDDSLSLLMNDILVITLQDIEDYQAIDSTLWKLRNTSMLTSLFSKTGGEEVEKEKTIAKLKILTRVWVKNLEYLLVSTHFEDLASKLVKLKVLLIPPKGQSPTVEMFVTELEATIAQVRISLQSPPPTEPVIVAEETAVESEMGVESVIEQSVSEVKSSPRVIELQQINNQKRQQLRACQEKINNHNQAVETTRSLLQSNHEDTMATVPSKSAKELLISLTSLKVTDIVFPAEIKITDNSTISLETQFILQNAELDLLLRETGTKLRMKESAFLQQNKQVQELEAKQQARLDELLKELKPLQIINNQYHHKLLDLNQQIQIFSQQLQVIQQAAQSVASELAQVVPNNSPVMAEIKQLSTELKQLSGDVPSLDFLPVSVSSDSKNLSVQIAVQQELIKQLTAQNLQLAPSWQINLKILQTAKYRFEELNSRLRDMRRQLPQWQQLKTLQADIKGLVEKNAATRKRIVDAQSNIQSQHAEIKRVLQSLSELFVKNEIAEQQSFAGELTELELIEVPESSKIPQIAGDVSIDELLPQQKLLHESLTQEQLLYEHFESMLREPLAALQEKFQFLKRIEQEQQSLLTQKTLNAQLRETVTRLNHQIKVHNENPAINNLQKNLELLVDEKSGYSGLLSAEFKNPQDLDDEFLAAQALQVKCLSLSCEAIDLSLYEFKTSAERHSIGEIQKQNDYLRLLISEKKSALSINEAAVVSAQNSLVVLQNKLQIWQQNKDKLVAEIKAKAESIPAINSGIAVYNPEAKILNAVATEFPTEEYKPLNPLDDITLHQSTLPMSIAGLQDRATQLTAAIDNVESAQHNLTMKTTQVTSYVESAETDYKISLARLRRADDDHLATAAAFERIKANYAPETKVKVLDNKLAATTIVASYTPHGTLSERVTELKEKRQRLTSHAERLQQKDTQLVAEIHTFKTQHSLAATHAALQALITQTKQRLRSYDTFWSKLFGGRQSDVINNLIQRPDNNEEVKSALDKDGKIMEIAIRNSYGLQEVYIRILILAIRLQKKPSLPALIQLRQALSDACVRIANDGNYARLATQQLSLRQRLFNPDNIKDKLAAAKTAVALHDYIDIAHVYAMKPSV